MYELFGQPINIFELLGTIVFVIAIAAYLYHYFKYRLKGDMGDG